MRLRGYLLIAVALLGACPGRGDGSEDAAVAAVVRLGGTVQRDANAPGTRIVTVDLSGTQVTDEDT